MLCYTAQGEIKSKISVISTPQNPVIPAQIIFVIPAQIIFVIPAPEPESSNPNYLFNTRK